MDKYRSIENLSKFNAVNIDRVDYPAPKELLYKSVLNAAIGELEVENG